jgi:hypothetical protein
MRVEKMFISSMEERIVKGRFFLIWLLGCLIIISRRPSVLLDAQLWSEDGCIFLDDAIIYGWKSFAIPYAGYIHLLPRIIAFLSLRLGEIFGQGIIWVPTIMNSYAVILSSFCATYICSSKFRWMGHIYFRILLSFFILAFPYAYEIYGNVTNLHWWFGILEFFLLWNMLQTRKMPNWSDTLLLSAAVFTSPNGLLVLPFILWGYFRVNKNKLDWDILKIILIFALTFIQLQFLLDVRVPKDIDIALFFNDATDYVFKQLFGNLLLGQSINSLFLSITGIFLLCVILFFGRGLFQKLYFPFAFLFSILFITILGADFLSSKYSRYVFVPTAVVVSILIYEGREQWRKRSKHWFSIAKITLFALFFLLISLRTVKNYAIDPFSSYAWKEQAALFDPQGRIFYNFQVNPIYWSVAIPSSYDRENYLPKSLIKISIDNSRIIEMHDIVVNDNHYTVTGPQPFVRYQLPERPLVSYCWIDFDHSLKYLEFVFACDNPDLSFDGQRCPMIFNVSENNLLGMNDRIWSNRMDVLQIYFFPLLGTINKGGVYSLPDSSFVIKRFELYAFPSE